MDYTRRRYQNESEGKCMDMLQLMKERHSVRQYKDKPIEQEKRAEIDRLISEINSEPIKPYSKKLKIFLM